MFKKLFTPIKFFIFAGLLFLVLALILTLVSNTVIQQSFLTRISTSTGKDIQWRAKTILKADDFSPKATRTKDIFDELFQKIRTTEIFKIKVWDKDARVIFSDDDSIVGKTFTDNKELQKALKGGTISNIEKPVKSENISELGYKQLLEVYIPITFNGDNGPTGVIEIYFKLDNINIQISETQRIIVVAVIFLTIASFVLLFIIFKTIVYSQVEKIRFLGMALLASATATVITDTKGTILWINPAFTKMTGYTSEEAIGQTTRLLNSGRQDKSFYQHLWETVLSGHIWQGELINKRKDGGLYVEEQTITPIKDEWGKIVRFIAVKQDITKRSEAEKIISEKNIKLEALNKAQEETEKGMLNVMEDMEETKKELELEKAKDEAILTSIGEGLIAVDNKRRIILLNNKAKQILGWKEHDLIGKVITDLRLEDEAGNLIPLDKRPTTIALATGKIAKVSYFFVRPDKTRFPLVITATPIKLGGKVIGLVEIIRDITREMEIDRAKSEFVSLASHQLRTPLGIMKWYLEALAGVKGFNEIPEIIRKYFEEINKNNERVLDLVRDLLSVSRIDQGRVKNTPKSVDLVEEIKEIVELMKIVANKKGVNLDLTTQAEKIPLVSIDILRFREVVENLINNAVDYSPAKSSIHVDVKKDNDTILISVKDTGIGISSEDQKKLFTKFFRSEKALTYNPEGSGLGLYVVKSYVESWGGKLSVESVEGKGSTFTVNLPISRKNDPPAGDERGEKI